MSLKNDVTREKLLTLLFIVLAGYQGICCQWSVGKPKQSYDSYAQFAKTRNNRRANNIVDNNLSEKATIEG
ncbi:MAG TPA: hypothetical protein VE643_05200 [Nitrososphaeraceae archaeon]|nr:hypothetical protein [Nitrososphaeraceae archaeon]